MTEQENKQEAAGAAEMTGVAVDIVCHRYSEDGWIETPLHVPNEVQIALYVNQKELVNIQCTPSKLNYLILGFLYGEGIISGIDDVMLMRVCVEESVADVRIKNSDFVLPTVRTLTAGCGGGAVFKTDGERVESNLEVLPEDVLSLMKQLLDQMELYRLSGGVHTSALADNKDLLVIAEDIGRHNTLDKITGECLGRGISTRDRLLLSTGRVSSEMLLKAAKMQVPIVVSRHSPTGRSVSLARDLGITLVGHARGGRLLVYSRPERLGCSTK